MGVICIPEIFQIDIVNKEDSFIVIASDGLWEVMDNKDVGKIVVPFYNNNDVQGASAKLVE